MFKGKRGKLTFFLIFVAFSVFAYIQKSYFNTSWFFSIFGKGEEIRYERDYDEKSDLPIFSFAVLGDTENFQSSKGDDFEKAARKIEETSPDLVFSVGDLTEFSQEEGPFRKGLNRWKKIMKPMMPMTSISMGDMDRKMSDRSESIWRSEFDLPISSPDGHDELVYSFNFSNSHFVVLDTEKPREHYISETQLDWLDYDLSGNDKENTFVFFHEPAFPIGPKIGASLDASMEQRDRLWTILDNHKVTAVFSGHEHVFSRRLIDKKVFKSAKSSIYQFVVGNTDAKNEKMQKNFYESDFIYLDHHYAIVDVNGDNITMNLYSTDGKLVDSFSFSQSD